MYLRAVYVYRGTNKNDALGFYELSSSIKPYFEHFYVIDRFYNKCFIYDASFYHAWSNETKLIEAGWKLTNEFIKPMGKIREKDQKYWFFELFVMFLVLLCRFFNKYFVANTSFFHACSNVTKLIEIGWKLTTEFITIGYNSGKKAKNTSFLDFMSKLF